MPLPGNTISLAIQEPGTYHFAARKERVMLMSITIRRLAQLAGVSHVTVLRALHGRDAVSAKTRLRVVELARKYHFPLPPSRATETPNLMRSLCSMVDIRNDEPQSDQGFHHRLLNGLTQGAAACGVELLNIGLSLNTGDPWRREWPLVVNRKQVDGAVLVMGDELVPHPPFPAPVPTVFIFNGPPEADVVTVANFDGGRLLGAHLAELGHRRVAYLGSRSSLSLERLAGLRTALELCGGSVPPEWTDILQGAGGRDRVVLRLDQLGMTHKAGDRGPAGRAGTEPRPVSGRGGVGFTALMCYNDYMAAAAILHLRTHGVRVPEDVSVVGFDNVRPDWYDGPALTTVNIPLEEIGAEAARLLYWRLAHPDAPPRRLVLNPSLVAGKSARAVG
jgi:LacI family repressor for deo operon, udp, cdd, tsx, nupC, and nupG